MFKKLPDLFSREFAIGYFIPAALFLILIVVGWQSFGPGNVEVSASEPTSDATTSVVEWLVGIIIGEPDEDSASGVDGFLGISLFLLLAWLLALVLAALNTPLFKLIEGYWGSARDVFGLRTRQIRKWRELEQKEEALWAELKEAQDNAREFRSSEELYQVRKRRAIRFPANEAWILPTSFGNILRAFETYSNTMFGLDAIPAWYRLLALVPDSYRKDIDQAKAFVDFWINLFCLSGLLIGFAAFVSVRGATGTPLWFVPLLILLMWLMIQGAKNAAVEWGEFVKATVELYRTKLQEQLSLPVSPGQSAAREMWQAYSSAVTFRDPEEYPSSAPAMTEQNSNP